MRLSESSAFVFSLRRVVWTGWRANVRLLTLLVSFTLFAGQQKGVVSVRLGAIAERR